MRAKDAFLLQVQATNALLIAHKEKFPRRPSLDPASSHVLRAVIVFLVAAIDAYIHKRIIEVVKRELRQHRTISPPAIKKIASGLGSDSIVSFVNLILKEKYYEELSKILEEKISGETFQKSVKLKEAFEIMGIVNGWERVTAHFYVKNKRKNQKGPRPKLELLLDELVERRDIIVHQGDMYFGKKYDGEFRSISRSKLEKDFQTLFKLLLSIEAVTEKI